MFPRRSFIALWLLLFPAVSLGQSLSGHLVINEVFLDTIQQRDSWIEIFNPTRGKITLKGLFASSIRTPNLLPIELKKKGGLDIEPLHYVIICWDKETFQSRWSAPYRTRVIDGLRFVKGGGVLRIWGIDQDSCVAEDDVVYGKSPCGLSQECVGTIDFARDGHSFSRFPGGVDTNDCKHDFVVTSPTPGAPNKK